MPKVRKAVSAPKHASNQSQAFRPVLEQGHNQELEINVVVNLPEVVDGEGEDVWPPASLVALKNHLALSDEYNDELILKKHSSNGKKGKRNTNYIRCTEELSSKM